LIKLDEFSFVARACCTTKHNSRHRFAEGIEVVVEPAAVRRLAIVAADLNQSVRNIGARRLHAVMEKVSSSYLSVCWPVLWSTFCLQSRLLLSAHDLSNRVFVLKVFEDISFACQPGRVVIDEAFVLARLKVKLAAVTWWYLTFPPEFDGVD
jgi:hypothetical protein